MKRQLFIASSLSAALAGCSAIGTKLNDNPAFHAALGSASKLNQAVIGTRGMARLYPKSAIDPQFRVNGFDTPSSSMYQHLLKDDFHSYRLSVDGAVENRRAFTLAELQKMSQRSQITRHDCVEGWSVVGEWSGVALGDLLDVVKPRSDARYVVFHCMDRSSDGDPYYESLNLGQARHPQTLLALQLNYKPLDADHGAPVRLRIPTQLGYK
ncbi:MAG: molybdopterin-dependent oxidoreductase, partial [Candidatus Eremiobacteraeota bacterium]|nr:molybdopterin-dependent oxidoreductase [Candidatus Eremiobacteraeota bacterium]